MTEKMTYLDHNATTPLKPEVHDAVLKTLAHPGNPSSIHKLGKEARKRVEEAREKIARLVNAGPKAVVVFTSGATEANNLVLKGSGCERFLVTAIEHSSVLQSCPHKELIPVLPNGLVDLAALDRMLEGNDRQTLISVAMVNNETGVIQPIEKVMEIAKRRGALVHTDAAQAAGRLPIDIQKLGVDFLTLSSHKMGGPQGVGCLVLSNCVSVKPLISGGSQEKNLRAGTENIPGIIGFGVAADLAVQDMEGFRRLAVLRDNIEAELQKIAPAVKFFGKESPRVSNTSMLALPGMSSETQMIGLDLAGICVSSGSACASGAVKPSHVLKAMGASDAETGSAIRVSFGWNSTEKDAETFVREWGKLHERFQNRLVTPAKAGAQ